MEELSALFYSGQLIWLSSLAFYIFDSSHKVGRDEIIIHRTWRGDWAALVPVLPMQSPRRRFGILPLLTPFLPALRVKPADQMPALSVRRIRQSIAPARSLRMVSALACALLFVVGPALTAYVGLGRALTVVVPAFLYCLACIFCVLAYNRRQLRLDWIAVFAIALEALICPGFAANSYRRAILRQRTMTGDVFALLAKSAAGRLSASRFAQEVQNTEQSEP